MRLNVFDQYRACTLGAHGHAWPGAVHPRDSTWLGPPLARHLCTTSAPPRYDYRPFLHEPGIEEVDAVVSTLGGTVKDPRADGEGNINIIEAAAKKVRRRRRLCACVHTRAWMGLRVWRCACVWSCGWSRVGACCGPDGMEIAAAAVRCWPCLPACEARGERGWGGVGWLCCTP